MPIAEQYRLRCPGCGQESEFFIEVRQSVRQSLYVYDANTNAPVVDDGDNDYAWEPEDYAECRRSYVDDEWCEWTGTVQQLQEAWVKEHGEQKGE